MLKNTAIKNGAMRCIWEYLKIYYEMSRIYIHRKKLLQYEESSEISIIKMLHCNSPHQLVILCSFSGDATLSHE